MLCGAAPASPLRPLTTGVSTEVRRVESLRTVLREYLVALDADNEFVAELLARCTLEPRTGSVVLLIPLARLREHNPVVPRAPV